MPLTNTNSEAAKKVKSLKKRFSIEKGKIFETSLYIFAVLFCLFVVLLLLIILWSSFQKGLPGVDAIYSLDNYKKALWNPNTWASTFNSFMVGIGTVSFNLLFAVPIAWLIQRTDLSHKNLYLTLMFIVSVVPGFLKTIAWIILANPNNGLINQLFRLFIDVDKGPLSIYNLFGISFVQGLTLTPIMFFIIGAAFLKIDNQLEEAGETSGANKLKVFWFITGPLVLPAIIAAMIFNFMTAIALFEAPALLGGPKQIYTLSTRIYFSVHSTSLGVPEYGMAGIYGLIMLLPALVMLRYYHKMLGQSHKYSVVTGKGYKAKKINLGKWKWVSHGFVWFYFTLGLLLPLLVLVWTSLIPYISIPNLAMLNLANISAYGNAFSRLFGQPLLNTIKLVLFSSMSVTIISLLISWIVLRTRMPGKYVIDTISMLPHGIPNIAFAFSLGFLALLTAKIVTIYGTVFIIILAHIIGFVSFGTRTINGALIQIHHELEQAAHVSGASVLITIRKIIIPLLLPALIYTLIWVAILSYKETTMAIFLQRPNNVVVASTIWNLWGAGRTAETAAAGVIMTITIAVLVFTMLKIGKKFGFDINKSSF